MPEAPTAAPVTDGGRFASRVLVALLLLAGVAFRVWILRSPLGLVDGDEAVVGLMARRALDGSFEAFFWGQEYGGSQESLLVALLLGLGIPGRWAMEAVPVGLHAGAAVLVWRIGRRTIVRPGGAALAAGVCWAASPALLWWSTKERGFYGFTLVCGLAALLCCARSVREPAPNGAGWGRKAGVGLGLALGLGWWASPQILHFAVPGLAWLAWQHRRRLADLARLLAVATPAAVLGALPWLWANAHTGLASLEPSADRATFGDPLPIFFRYGLPMVLGLRAPITLAWEPTGARIAYGLVLAGLAAILLLRPRRLGLVLVVVAAYPLVFAALPTTYYYGEPRYLDFLWPLLALVAGWALVRVPPAVRGVALAGLVALTAYGVDRMTGLQGPPGDPFEDVSPASVGPLVRTLDTLGADHAFADYWVAYRLTWEAGGRITATPLQLVRDEAVERDVRRDDRPVFVVVPGRCGDRVQQALARVGVGFEVTSVARTWDVVVPDRRVLPDELGPTC